MKGVLPTIIILTASTVESVVNRLRPSANQRPKQSEKRARRDDQRTNSERGWNPLPNARVFINRVGWSDNA
jgi:hypothetical protein